MQILTPIILAAVLCHTVHMQGAGNVANDCCLKTKGKRIPFNHIAGYTIQDKDSGCHINAAVFHLHNEKILCATPDLPWVIKAIKKINKMKRGTTVKNTKAHQKKRGPQNE